MSITFSTQPEAPKTDYTVKFWCDKEEFISKSSEEALNVKSSHQCNECSAYGGPITDYLKVVNDIQMSNTNAMDLLSLLGINDSYCGEESSEQFLGRVILAKELIPAELSKPTEKFGNTIFVGREPGYFHNKLENLSILANWAYKNNATINWG